METLSYIKKPIEILLNDPHLNVRWEREPICGVESLEKNQKPEAGYSSPDSFRTGSIEIVLSEPFVPENLHKLLDPDEELIEGQSGKLTDSGYVPDSYSLARISKKEEKTSTAYFMEIRMPGKITFAVRKVDGDYSAEERAVELLEAYLKDRQKIIKKQESK